MSERLRASLAESEAIRERQALYIRDLKRQVQPPAPFCFGFGFCFDALWGALCSLRYRGCSVAVVVVFSV
eukprot:1964726-Rhodomonas_salina.2